MPGELAALLGPDPPALGKNFLLLWRDRPASHERSSQRVCILKRRRCRELVFVAAQLDGAGREAQNHRSDAYDN